MIKFNFSSILIDFTQLKFNFDQLCRNYEFKFMLAYSSKMV